MINDLIENLKVDGVPSALPESFCRDSENDSENLAPPELEISDDPIRESLDEADSELAFNRSNTVETIKPVNSAIPIRPSSSKQLDITDDYRLSSNPTRSPVPPVVRNTEMQKSTVLNDIGSSITTGRILVPLAICGLIFIQRKISPSFSY